MCGDFNAVMSEIDAHPESRDAVCKDAEFISEDRQGLLKLVDIGFADAYRLMHHEERGVYTWWASKVNLRDENKGARLDYFLVSKGSTRRIRAVKVHTDVMGSDHCPIELHIDIPDCFDERVELSGLYGTARYESIAGLGLTESNAYFKSPKLAEVWDKIDWRVAEDKLLEMQTAISKQAAHWNAEGVARLQDELTKSIEARVLAVRRVCSNASGTGPDGIRWVTSEEKMSAALTLTSVGYQSAPAQMVRITTKDGKERLMQVLNWHDRAMQTLYAFALDPVSEAHADHKSFAFRKGRSTYDLDTYIIRMFSGIDAPKWVITTGATKCYGSLNHDHKTNVKRYRAKPASLGEEE